MDSIGRPDPLPRAFISLFMDKAREGSDMAIMFVKCEQDESMSQDPPVNAPTSKFPAILCQGSEVSSQKV